MVGNSSRRSSNGPKTPGIDVGIPREVEVEDFSYFHAAVRFKIYRWSAYEVLRSNYLHG